MSIFSSCVSVLPYTSRLFAPLGSFIAPRARRTSMLVRLRLRRPGLMAEAAQSIDTFDLVPKKRVVPLRPGCCSSPKSSAFRGPRIEIWY